ncbi:hypothetical protein [Spiroplasma alleghenense]|uniref:Metallothionein n=1 Tax=Spiroplasma alleghenense TaxID=216931 RepID=A0A345Z557_9MOLU|nr:hypothetical protein [Spiroplasma alleghenense]AXK51736.1 hypothetical protein SALLE_v1c10660 [Spiroplasma alleghenense]
MDKCACSTKCACSDCGCSDSKTKLECNDPHHEVCESEKSK